MEERARIAAVASLIMTLACLIIVMYLVDIGDTSYSSIHTRRHKVHNYDFVLNKVPAMSDREVSRACA